MPCIIIINEPGTFDWDGILGSGTTSGTECLPNNVTIVSWPSNYTNNQPDYAEQLNEYYLTKIPEPETEYFIEPEPRTPYLRNNKIYKNNITTKPIPHLRCNTSHSGWIGRKGYKKRKGR